MIPKYPEAVWIVEGKNASLLSKKYIHVFLIQ